MESWSVIAELAPCLHRFLTMREESRSLFVALLRLVQWWRHSLAISGLYSYQKRRRQIISSRHCSGWYSGDAIAGLYSYQERRKQISVRGIAQVGTMVRTVFFDQQRRKQISIRGIAQVGTMARTVFGPAEKEADLCSWHCSGWYNGDAIAGLYSYQQRRR